MPNPRERTDERTYERRQPDDDAGQRRSREPEEERIPVQIGEDPGTLEPERE